MDVRKAGNDMLQSGDREGHMQHYAGYKALAEEVAEGMPEDQRRAMFQEIGRIEGRFGSDLDRIEESGDGAGTKYRAALRA